MAGMKLMAKANGDCCCVYVCDLIASFTAAQSGTYPTLLWTFTDTSTTGCPGGIVSWAWDFGDGATSTLQNPTHTFPTDSPGPWLVTLTVTDDCDCTDDVQMEVHRMVSCNDLVLWAQTNFTSVDATLAGVGAGTCASCAGINGTYNLPPTLGEWSANFTCTSCGGGSSPSCGVAFGIGCPTNRIPLGPHPGTLSMVLYTSGIGNPSITSLYKIYPASALYSTGIFSAPITLNQTVGGTNCNLASASATIVGNF